MTGVKIRMSKFARLGARSFDMTTGLSCSFSPAAVVIYPHQTPEVGSKMSGRGAPLFLVRLTEWNGETMRQLCEPTATAPLGGDGCVVDLVVGFDDAAEIESLRILSLVVGEAHRHGLPVLVSVRLNEAGCKGDYAPFLAIPIAAAEEIGADGVILPRIGEGRYEMEYQSSVPLFFAEEDGAIVREEL